MLTLLALFLNAPLLSQVATILFLALLASWLKKE